jgi:hypothetical protein
MPTSRTDAGLCWAIRCARQTPWPVGDAAAAPAAATHYCREVGEAYWRGLKTEPSIWDLICGDGGTGAQEAGAMGGGGFLGPTCVYI